MSTVKVKWQASDGYASGQRPQQTTIEVSDFVGLSKIEAEKLFEEIMEESFRQKVCWYCDDYDASLQEIMDAAAKLEEAE